MQNISYIICIIFIILCVIGVIVYITFHDKSSTHSSKALHDVHTTIQQQKQQHHHHHPTQQLSNHLHHMSTDKHPSHASTSSSYEDTETVLPSYVESRSVPLYAENVQTQPYLQQTNNQMSLCSQLPNDVPPTLDVVKHTPPSKCPRVNFWCSPLCGIYV